MIERTETALIICACGATLIMAESTRIDPTLLSYFYYKHIGHVLTAGVGYESQMNSGTFVREPQ